MIATAGMNGFFLAFAAVSGRSSLKKATQASMLTWNHSKFLPFTLVKEVAPRWLSMP